MPRYFFNARKADGRLVEDQEGLEYAHVDEARTEVERAKVETLGKLLGTGVPPSAIPSGVVEVADESGAVVARVPSKLA